MGCLLGYLFTGGLYYSTIPLLGTNHMGFLMIISQELPVFVGWVMEVSVFFFVGSCVEQYLPIFCDGQIFMEGYICPGCYGGESPARLHKIHH